MWKITFLKKCIYIEQKRLSRIKRALVFLLCIVKVNASVNNLEPYPRRRVTKLPHGREKWHFVCPDWYNSKDLSLIVE